MEEKILVIDDDVECLALLEKILTIEGYKATLAQNGNEGVRLAYEQHPNLIMLDIMMPGQDGYQVCAHLREITQVPILMLTAKDTIADMERGFTTGADDYVKKPFSKVELVSRIKALLRREKRSASGNRGEITNYSDGILTVDLIKRNCVLQNNVISLTFTEFNLLAFLIQNPNQSLSSRTLLTHVWGDGYSQEKGLLSFYIHQLRQKLMDSSTDHQYIQTQWGKGYRFNPLPQVLKNASTPGTIEQTPDSIKPIRSVGYKWVWVALAFLLFQLVMKTENILGIFTNLAKESTTLEALMTTEGFSTQSTAGVRGQICITNSGKYPTENLSIVDNVQIFSENQRNYISVSVDISQRPILNPGQSFCYPYETLFDSISGQDVKYRNLASITITNYVDLLPNSEHCPGSEPCSFGPNLITDFDLPEP